MSKQSYHKSRESQFCNVETARLIELRTRYRQLIDLPPPDPDILIVHERRYRDRLAETLAEIENVLAAREGGR